MQGFPFPIITYQVITGNYSVRERHNQMHMIITYQVITGNYSIAPCHSLEVTDYNIPSNNRELQLLRMIWRYRWHYNIPSNNRELQPYLLLYVTSVIITYQVITGNYSSTVRTRMSFFIITYQVITGNYSMKRRFLSIVLL